MDRNVTRLNVQSKSGYVISIVLLIGVLISPAYKTWAQGAGPTVVDPNLAVRTVASGLNTPTSMAFIGHNDILVLEKGTGRVRRVVNGVIQSTVLDLAVNSGSERGLLGIALHPNFPTTPFVYLYWTESSTGQDTEDLALVPLLGNRVDRFRWDGSTLTPDQNIIRLHAFQADSGQPLRGNHNGGVIRFGPDGKLYIIIGDNGRRGLLQNNKMGPVPDDQFGGPEPDNAHLTGVILRLNADGTTPTDNPFFAAGATMGGEVGANIQKIFAYGVRNSFGLAFDPQSGFLWDEQNGDDSFDEINRISPGANLGWVQIMGPVERIAQFKAIEVSRPGGLQQIRWPPTLIADTPAEALSRLFVLPGSQYTDPEFSWKFSVAPAGIGFLNSSALGPQYQGDLFVGAARTTLAGGYLFHFNLTGNRRRIAVDDPRLEDRVADNTDKFDITESESLLFGRNFGVGTDIETGPNGNLFVVSLSDGAIYEIYRVDVCMQDERSGDSLRFNSQTGDFQFIRCGANGFTLSGRGHLTKQGCTIELNDARVSAVLTRCPTSSLDTGSAVIRLNALGPRFVIEDRDTTNNNCNCR
ncbi:MAG TPA: PQQ-dependent sugar dehydrogenase [Blastocatellia bacterium]|nr:PQQ-dependent sugar dehydrogenase [Blastocatellia bacterium]